MYGHDYANPILEDIEFPKLVSPNSKALKEIEAKMKSLIKPQRKVVRLSVASGETLFRQDIKAKDRRAWLEVGIFMIDERDHSQPSGNIWQFKISEKEIQEAYSLNGVQNESDQRDACENIRFFLSVMGFSLVDAMKRGFAKDIDIEVSQLGLEYHFSEKRKVDALSTAFQILLSKGRSGLWYF